MPRTLFLPAAAMILFLTSCQKDFTAARNPVDPAIFADDTSRILSIVQFDYIGGLPADSSITVYRNHTLNGEKKIISTTTFSAAPDTFRSEFIYNAANELVQINSTDHPYTAEIDKEVIIRSGNFVTEIDEDSAGTVKYRYLYNYTPAGANYLVTATILPRSNHDTTYHPDGSIFTASHSVATATVNSNILPVSSIMYSHFYLNNTGATFPNQNQWDTARIFYNFTGNGDLAVITRYNNVSDTGNGVIYPGGTQAIQYYRDTITSTYTRNNTDNLFFTNFIVSLYGQQLYNLSSFFSSPFTNNEIHESFSENVFNNHALNTLTTGHRSSLNNVPGTAYISTDAVYRHFFDSQNRLVKTLKLDLGTGAPIAGMRVIYP